MLSRIPYHTPDLTMTRLLATLLLAGLLLGPLGCATDNKPGEPAKILRVGNQPGDQCAWDIQNVSLGPGFVAAVVVERR